MPQPYPSSFHKYSIAPPRPQTPGQVSARTAPKTTRSPRQTPHRSKKVLRININAQPQIPLHAKGLHPTAQGLLQRHPLSGWLRIG